MEPLNIRRLANDVSFAPNGLNRAFHEDVEAIDVSAGDIESVRRHAQA